MARRFLVTGGTGFIGSRIVLALRRAGFEVCSYHRPGDPTTLLEGSGASLVEGDIADSARLAEAMEGSEGVFHVAGNVSMLRRDRAIQRHVNVEGTRAVVAACRRAGVRRLVHTSTVDTLGIPDPPGSVGNESTPFNWGPLGFHYAITKKEGEEIALAANGAALQVVVVNPGTAFGPGDINCNAGTYILAIAKGPVPFYPDGGANCVHVDVVAAGHLAAFERGRPGERYILGGENLTYREIFATIAAILGRPVPRVQIPWPIACLGACAAESASRLSGTAGRLSLEAARCGRFLLFYSSAKARRELGLPLIPFRVAVQDAVAWYRDRGTL